uniref:Uncharacterized protein n=1 Tax=Pithovirus LCPAC001 TaxID=2506585 RepID=A0A481Z226_9VIRU|nr:MAG: uncharacterized protein LCPAC001_00140 [Pithovirus LCPAC001]
MSGIFYHGEQMCQGTYRNGKDCRNNAYYSIEKSMPSPQFSSTLSFLRCGLHSKKGNRADLLKNPNAKKRALDRINNHRKKVDEVAKENKANNIRGIVVCSKLRMFKGYQSKSGYLNVFPNNRHQNRTDGFGCCSLSPMRLGPVLHNQPGLPEAKNIENFHQGNKCFSSEIDEKGDPKPIFYETQRKLYLDHIPHRHKEAAKGIKNNKNIPLFSIWKKKTGKEKRCTYIESRKYYCRYYEQLAKKTDDYKILARKIDDGYNLNIIGYDAYTVTKSAKEHYLDSNRPFGHELVLYTLLTVNEKEYPWRNINCKND